MAKNFKPEIGREITHICKTLDTNSSVFGLGLSSYDFYHISNMMNGVTKKLGKEGIIITPRQQGLDRIFDMDLDSNTNIDNKINRFFEYEINSFMDSLRARLKEDQHDNSNTNSNP